MLQYFKTFGDRACCFPDINPYLLLLPKDQVDTVRIGVFNLAIMVSHTLTLFVSIFTAFEIP